MIYYIKGKIAEILDGAVAVENGGIAYLVNVPSNSRCFIAAPDETVTLYTAMIVKEDDVSLYGFTDKAGLVLFRRLMTVQGVGAKAALSVLSVGSVAEIRQAVVFEDISFIQRASGIGKKTAQRIVLELKDKLEKDGEIMTAAFSALSGENTAEQARQQAAEALVSLGYTKIEAQAALTGIKADSAEDYISQALKNK